MERIERKILQVVAEPRIWGDDRGNGRAAEVGFVLETKEGVREYGEYRSTESAWRNVVERSTPSVGQVFTFEAEPKKPYQGTNQWALKSYPGKPEGDYKGGGGKGAKNGDWETSVERADRRLNDAATKVLGVAAVLVGDEGPASDRASALVAITPVIADAFLVAREALAPSFPTLGAAPADGPAAQAKPWGPAPGTSDAADVDPSGDLAMAWERLVELTGSKSKGLMALNHHFERKANADEYSFAEVMEVCFALA